MLKQALKAAKTNSIQIGPIKAFGKFALDIPTDVEVSNFLGVLIWCEAFGQFITKARLQQMQGYNKNRAAIRFRNDQEGCGCRYEEATQTAGANSAGFAGGD